MEEINRKNEILEIVSAPIRRYMDQFKCTVSVELSILDECFVRVEETREKYFESSQGSYNINTFKMAGIICFWIRKLKPFYVTNNAADHRYINEYIAFLTGYTFVYNDVPLEKRRFLPKITPHYFHDLINSFRYHSHSPHSTAFIFESLGKGE
jgi:hypothetical protein